ncbi:MAG TPA: crosslink repair DNA glycosylase YcaQ family protein [Opitutaceae bacterium]|nr:crosslink repair DNA glycosylase YcaQ family protein [Opitutaceae bacterium]
MTSAFKVSLLQARRFLLRSLGLSTPFSDIGQTIAHLGYVQMDPINVCGRMHDLILRNRVENYREGDLLRFLYGTGATLKPKQRVAFEHYLPSGILVALPIEAWPYLTPRMQARRTAQGFYSGQLSSDEEKLAQHILKEITTRGALTSDDIEHEASATTGWGGRSRQVKTVLEKLFVHGRVLITSRNNHFRRIYDLPERVLPRRVLNAKPASLEEMDRWSVSLHMKQHRLVRLKKAELSLIRDLVQLVSVAEYSGSFHCLHNDIAHFDPDQNVIATPGEPILLAPLDPLIYDRRVTAVLWDFKYTWEVYTPDHKRTRGYYALPILSREEIVGHVDPKADRKKKKLQIVSRYVKRGHRVAVAVARLARFLGLS